MVIVRVPFLWVDGMALFPLVLVRRRGPSATLLNHECIHLRQQLELGIVFFYLWYVVEYAIRRWQYPSHYVAYRNISFEREAFANEQNTDYLAARRPYAFRHYVRLRDKQ